MNNAAAEYFNRKRHRTNAAAYVEPDPIGAITDAAAAAASATSLTVTFTSADNAAYHKVRYAPAGGGQWVYPSGKVVSGGAITGLNPASNYDVQVRGLRADSDFGPWSNIATASTS